MRARVLRPRAHALVRLVSRLLAAQAGAGAVIGLTYGRRTVGSVLTVALLVLAVSGLAGLVRSGGHGIWLVAVSAEAGFSAAGLFWFAYSGYLGGLLLALITLGTMLHPAVARAFVTSARTAPDGAAGPARRAEPAGDMLPGRVAG